VGVVNASRASSGKSLYTVPPGAYLDDEAAPEPLGDTALVH